MTRSTRHPVFVWCRRIVGCGLLLLASVAAMNLWIFARTQSRVHRALADVPAAEIALVLGNAPAHPATINRLAAAAALYQAGKVQRILVSGSIEPPVYDEVAYMRGWLIRHGVPASAIEADGEGFRTRASIANFAGSHSGQRVLLVSQAFHNYRALYLADAYGLQAEAYAAEEVDWYYRRRNEAREILSRTWAFLELLPLSRPRA